MAGSQQAGRGGMASALQQQRTKTIWLLNLASIVERADEQVLLSCRGPCPSDSCGCMHLHAHQRMGDARHCMCWASAAAICCLLMAAWEYSQLWLPSG